MLSAHCDSHHPAVDDGAPPHFEGSEGTAVNQHSIFKALAPRCWVTLATVSFVRIAAIPARACSQLMPGVELTQNQSTQMRRPTL